MKSNGFATILLMIPVLTVPALAIFGIPQFAPVVASPLDEGRNKDNESRVGNSARESHDELVGDFEDIGAEPAAKEDSLAKRRSGAVSGSGNRRNGSRQFEESTIHGWSDDAKADSDWPSKSRRRSASLEADEDVTPGISDNHRNPRKPPISERLTRNGRRELPATKVDDAIRVASTADVDAEVLQAEFIEGEIAKPQVANPENRSRFDDSSTKRRETPTAPLTWQSVQERLNELEIRSFRLEPGHQPGQFIFICSYTPADNPRVSYRFEAGADEPLKAVEKVLEQIVKWRQLR